MAYSLKEITIRTDNSVAGMIKIADLWYDIETGHIPLMVDNEGVPQNVIPIAKYSNYESDASGEYDLSVMAVTPEFIQELDGKAESGKFKKFDVVDFDGNMEKATKAAWEQIWKETTSGELVRKFTEDFELAVPSNISEDGKTHCFVWIAI